MAEGYEEEGAATVSAVPYTGPVMIFPVPMRIPHGFVDYGKLLKYKWVQVYCLAQAYRLYVSYPDEEVLHRAQVGGGLAEVDAGRMFSRMSTGTGIARRETGEAKIPYLRELL